MKIIKLSAVLVILIFQIAGASCLPKVKIPDSYFKCEVDSDCVVAGDACRSCGEPWVVNKAYQKDLEAMDEKLRQKAKCHLSCEACSTQWVQARCEKERCKNVGKRPTGGILENPEN